MPISPHDELDYAIYAALAQNSHVSPAQQHRAWERLRIQAIRHTGLPPTPSPWRQVITALQKLGHWLVLEDCAFKRARRQYHSIQPASHNIIRLTTLGFLF